MHIWPADSQNTPHYATLSVMSDNNVPKLLYSQSLSFKVHNKKNEMSSDAGSAANTKKVAYFTAHSTLHAAA